MLHYTGHDLLVVKNYKLHAKVKEANKGYNDKLTVIELLIMLRRFSFKCVYCGDCLKAKSWQLDHFYSRAMGGKNMIDNVCPSCRRCNIMKLDMDGFSFIARCKKILENNIISKFNTLSTA